VNRLLICFSMPLADSDNRFMPFACIFVPDFPLQALLRAHPALCSLPVAVLEGKPPLQKIMAVNEQAHSAGVRPGMTRLQVEGSPEIIFREQSEIQERIAHQTLLDCAQSFSPRVEDAGLDTVLLDISGLNSLFGPLPKIAREISRHASSLGLKANVSIAATLEAAILAAHGFSGVTLIPQGKEADILGSLPVNVLFSVEPDSAHAQIVLDTFERWGIRKFRDLALLPPSELSQRLGRLGLELQQKALGAAGRTLVPSHPPLIFAEAVELEFPLVLLEPLAFLLSGMLEQLCQRLQSRALAAQELCLELTLDNGRHPDDRNHPNRFQRVIHLPVPLLYPDLFLKLLQLDLKAHPPGAPILKVELRIEPAKPRPAQNGLFIPSSPQAEKLELTLARIGSVVGAGRAGSPKLLDTHRPQAFEMRHFAPPRLDPGSAGVPAGIRNSPGNADLVTALRIFRPPVVIAVNQKNGKLAHVSAQKPDHIDGEVLWSAGPWRSSGDWWEQDSWVRDEWDIAVQGKNTIALYRLVHDLLGGRWMLEGSYD
jgi:protein ImuB